ncbi:MAG: type II secretion system GspH family protein [Candidatus Omnitrophica bacterium]|nr:type II secretion system GspH family protein [Candidatus Omnitrophota bacterium]MBU1048350.1 type II secretion system GspH family protein [Candidatus Omnitrophota bacterium]MBU1631192.1 type II secretion system GspH family protein [Candidatus Omnitrophota bacterium]MBU1767755.1 type II secretion system GspH family protein [Candidatus Omnitrophota bacterium]MBU1889668.1 type II secretion system GspH family protein [Candidatus Omnitrophota bacterium]
MKNSNKGLTLLEMAISMAILAIALVALANLFPIGLKLSRRASTFSEASILAQRVIDNIKIAASIYDVGDGGPNALPTPFSDNNCIGYFELANPYVAPGSYYFPFNDNDLEPFVVGDAITDIVTGYTTYTYRYKDTDMTAYVKSVDWDANGNTRVGREDLLPANWDWDDVLLSQKVYVAIYWTEADRGRADTFITYISNPFYEKYR